MQKSDSIKELATALASVQGELKSAVKNKENPFHKSTYADLESSWDACRIILSKNGLSVSQLVDSVDGDVALTTILMHTSGEYILSTAKLALSKPGPQEVGSCVSYYRRYALQAIVGLATTDDDAEAAEKSHRQSTASYPSVVKNYPTQTKTTEAKHTDIDSYVIGFGKFKGKKLVDLDPYEVSSYVEYMNRSGEPAKGKAAEFLKMAELWLAFKSPEKPAALDESEEFPNFN